MGIAVVASTARARHGADQHQDLIAVLVGHVSIGLNDEKFVGSLTGDRDTQAASWSATKDGGHHVEIGAFDIGGDQATRWVISNANGCPASQVVHSSSFGR